MINVPLFKQNIKSNYKILLIFMAVLTLYVSMMVAMFDPEIGKTLESFTQTMPEVMAMFGMDVVASTLTGFLSNYLYGFLMLLFPMVFTIILANKMVARHVDRGSMAYLLASPNTRLKIAFTQLASLILNIAVLIAYVTVLGIVCSQAMFPGELEIGSFIWLNAGVFCLHFAVASICFLASCLSNETKRFFLFGAGIPILFYLIQMLANMGGKLENLKYATLFTLFNAGDIVAGNAEARLLFLVMLGIGVSLFGISLAVFCKRDLPL